MRSGGADCHMARRVTREKVKDVFVLKTNAKRVQHDHRGRDGFHQAERELLL